MILFSSFKGSIKILKFVKLGDFWALEEQLKIGKLFQVKILLFARQNWALLHLL